MPHTFGGSWTEEKLAVMRSYFAAYAQALKSQRFAKWYIDAFAGTGERNEVKRPGSGGKPLFGDDASEVGEVKDGSVRIALAIDPPFDRYIFVNRALCQSINWRTTRAAVFIDPYGMQVNWSTLESLATTKAVDIALLYPTGPLNRMLAKHGNIPRGNGQSG